VLAGHVKPVDAVAYRPDGHTLATGSEDWTAMLWETDPERLATWVCATAQPAITRAQWGQYFSNVAYEPPCPER
jgi:WD40 repeat protein